MPLQVGIFGIRCALEQPLKAGDRVEVYRALTINPKDIRRKRAEKIRLVVFKRVIALSDRQYIKTPQMRGFF